MTHDLYTLISEAPDIYLDEIQDWIALAYEFGISKCSLFRNIRDAGVTYKLLRKAAAERDEDARQEWKDEVNAHFTAVQMVFVDETSKDDRSIYCHYGRAPNGQRATIRSNFGGRITVMRSSKTASGVSIALGCAGTVFWIVRRLATAAW